MKGHKIQGDRISRFHKIGFDGGILLDVPVEMLDSGQVYRLGFEIAHFLVITTDHVICLGIKIVCADDFLVMAQALG